MELEITFRNKNKMESSLTKCPHPAGGGADWLPHGHQALRGDQMGELLVHWGQIYILLIQK